MLGRSRIRSKVFLTILIGSFISIISGCNAAAPSPVVEPAEKAMVASATPASPPVTTATTNEPVLASSALPAPSASAALLRGDGDAMPTPSAAVVIAPPTPPPLVDAAGVLLPQTEDKPSIESPLFQHRLGLLVKAIETGDAEVARDFFFPKVAYEKVKAIKKPGRDWESRLWKLFKRDIEEYHAKLGEHARGTKLVKIEINDSRLKWMKPNSEGNAIGYHRVTRNKLHLRDGAGNEQVFEVTAFISWRGEWYVVHLHGFK